MSNVKRLPTWRLVAAAAALCSTVAANAWTGTGVIEEVRAGEVVISDGALAAPPDLRVNMASGVGSIGVQQLKPGMPVRFELDESNPGILKEVWILNSLPKSSGQYGDER